MSSETKMCPALPWRPKLFLTTFTFAVDISRRSNGTVNRFLFNLFDFKVSASNNNKPINNDVTTFDTTIDPSRNLWFRLYIPAIHVSSTSSLPVIIYYHGGGFAFLAADSLPCDDFCRRLARELPAVVISLNYRLSPEHRFPSQYEDGFDVLKFIDQTRLSGFPANGDLSRCFLAGDSAGGNLAHHVALKSSEYEFKEVKVIGLVAIQPFFGGEERTESEMRLVRVPVISVERTDWLWKAFLGDESDRDRDHPVVNVFGPKSVDISGVKFPATIVFVGGFDPLQEWQKRYYEGLKKCGKEAYLIEYPNAIHTFYAFPEFPESSLFITELRAFVQKQCSANISNSHI